MAGSDSGWVERVRKVKLVAGREGSIVMREVLCGGWAISISRRVQHLSAWDVSKVSDMSFMFEHAEAFNQDLSGWDTSCVTSMRRMFQGAAVFDQRLR